MGGIRAVKEARETLSGGQIYPFVVSLDAHSCSLSHGAVHVDIL